MIGQVLSLEKCVHADLFRGYKEFFKCWMLYRRNSCSVMCRIQFFLNCRRGVGSLQLLINFWLTWSHADKMYVGFWTQSCDSPLYWTLYSIVSPFSVLVNPEPQSPCSQDTLVHHSHLPKQSEILNCSRLCLKYSHLVSNTSLMSIYDLWHKL